MGDRRSFYHRTRINFNTSIPERVWTKNIWRGINIFLVLSLTTSFPYLTYLLRRWSAFEHNRGSTRGTFIFLDKNSFPGQWHQSEANKESRNLHEKDKGSKRTRTAFWNWRKHARPPEWTTCKVPRIVPIWSWRYCESFSMVLTQF